MGIGGVGEARDARIAPGHHQIVVLDAGDRPPAMVEARRVERPGDRRHGDGGATERAPQGLVLHHVEAGTARGRRRHDRPGRSGYVVELPRPELGILHESRLQAPEPGGQRAAERPAGRLTGGEEDADLVVAEPVSGNSLCRVDGGH